MEYALLQAVFLPLLLSPLAYIIGRRLGHTAATWFTFGLLLYCTILIITASIGETYEEHYPWTELFGEFGFLLDGLAAPFAIMIYVLCTILALYSKPYMQHKFHEFFKQQAPKTVYQRHLRMVLGMVALNRFYPITKQNDFIHSIRLV